MSDAANWRTDINSSDYFGQQKKQLAVADRRPVIRKSSDIAGMGPGFGQNTVRITDFNDQLATYNGFYSALGTALNAPISADDADELVGYISQDSTFGGVQSFTRLSDGSTYQRTFTRAPGDPETIFWSAWEEPPAPDPEEGVWQVPSLTYAWVNYGSPFPNAGYMRKNGICYLRGLIKDGGIGVGTPFFTLPVGFRPASAVSHIFNGTVGNVATGAASTGTAHTHAMSNVAARVNIGGGSAPTDGIVYTEAPITNPWISLNGISFPIEA